MKEKFVFITNIPVPYRYELYKRFVNQQDVEAYVLFHTLQYDDVTWDENLEENSKFQIIGARNIKTKDGHGSYSLNLYKYLKQLKPSVVIINDYSPIMIVQVLLYKKFIDKKLKIISMTDENARLFANLSHIKFRKLIRKIFLKRANYCITSSESGKKHIQSLVKLPIKVSYLTPEKIYYHNNLKKSKRMDDVINILIVARLVNIKRIDRLVKAVYLLNTQNNNWKLTIVGEGPEVKYLKKMVLDLGLKAFVSFKGRKTGQELIEEYYNADIYVMCSEYEAWGLTVHEAMLCNLACIVTESVGSSELVNNAGGIVIKDKEKADIEIVKDISQTLNTLISNPMKIKQIANFSKEYAESITIDEQINIFLATVQKVSSQ